MFCAFVVGTRIVLCWIILKQNFNKEASRLYAELLLCVGWHSDHICFFLFVLCLISTVCEVFFTNEVPCFTLQDIFICGEVLVLAFLSDPSNLWLHIFCSRYGFFSSVLFLISTVCEVFFTK